MKNPFDPFAPCIIVEPMSKPDREEQRRVLLSVEVRRDAASERLAIVREQCPHKPCRMGDDAAWCDDCELDWGGPT